MDEVWNDWDSNNKGDRVSLGISPIASQFSSMGEVTLQPDTRPLAEIVADANERERTRRAGGSGIPAQGVSCSYRLPEDRARSIKAHDEAKAVSAAQIV